jgi:hypothetical protein
MRTPTDPASMKSFAGIVCFVALFLNGSLVFAAPDVTNFSATQRSKRAYRTAATLFRRARASGSASAPPAVQSTSQLIQSKQKNG